MRVAALLLATSPPAIAAPFEPLAPLLPQDAPAPTEPAPAGDAPAAPTYDLLLSREPGGPFLVEIESTDKGSVEVKVGSLTNRSVMTGKSTRRFVDEITAGPPAMKMSRCILKWDVDVDGKARDPDCVGLTFDGTCDESQFAIAARGDRRVSQEALDRILPFAVAPALHLPLLDDWAIGAEITSNARCMLHQLLGMDGAIAAGDCRLTLAEVDEVRQRGVARGTFTLQETKDDDEIKGTADWTGTLEVEVDLALKRVASARAEAKVAGRGDLKVTGAGTGGGSVVFEGEVKASAKVVAGAPAEAARKATAKIRDRDFLCPAGGVSLKLPSSFQSFQSEPEALLAYAVGTQQLTIAMQRFPLGDLPAKDAISSVLTELRKQNPALSETRDVKSALGKGKAVSHEVDGVPVDIEFYLLGKSHLLRLRILGPPELRKLHDKALTAMRASLKALNP